MTARVLRDGRSPFGLSLVGFIAVVAVLAACAYGVLIALGGSTRASAAPIAPAPIGEILGTEVPIEVPIGNESGLSGIQSMAIEQSTGDVDVVVQQAVIELTPYGGFILEFGPQVNKTKVRERAEGKTVSGQEENICTAASGDVCGKGVYSENGAGGEMPNGQSGIAVEQSTGAIYVDDSSATGGRVEKFTKGGAFVLTFGNEVNKTKVEAREKGATVTQQEEDLCTEASGDACQRGTEGSGKPIYPQGQQEFGGLKIAIGGPQEHLYLGGVGRVQVLDGEGHLLSEDSLSPLTTEGVTSLAVNNAGDAFFTVGSISGVHELEPSGALSSNVFGATKLDQVTVDNAGHLFAVESPHVFEYVIASPSTAPTEPALGEHPTVDDADTVYTNSYNRGGEIEMFGSLASMESAYGTPPRLAPAVGSETASTAPEDAEAGLRGEVNPQYSPTTYQFQYGPEPCTSGHCTSLPATPAPVGADKTFHELTVTLTDLQIGKVYYARAVATSAVSTTFGGEIAFTAGRGPTPGAAGLPDGRHYELVTPANKSGFETERAQFGLASADGNAVLYTADGALGNSPSSAYGDYVSRRANGVWSTEAATPPKLGTPNPGGAPREILPSGSFQRFAFSARGGEYSPEEPLGPLYSVNLFVSDSPFSDPSWLGRPAITDPTPAPGNNEPEGYVLAGASSDLTTVYFAYAGTLLPQDAPRAPHVGNGGGAGEPWGFYEWNEGMLNVAGVLPDGNVNPFGAMPASLAGETNIFDRSPEELMRDAPEARDNEVSEDGSRAFFVSPDPKFSDAADPVACVETKKALCSSEPPQLYVRETDARGAKSTVLVSQNQLPGEEGTPAPDGVSNVEGYAPYLYGTPVPRQGFSYAYASPDGSQVYFVSVDRLTSAAPSDRQPKEYDFDLATGKLTFLPDVTGPILASARDGSDFVFLDTARTPLQLELWSAGSGGGSVRPIAQLAEVREHNPVEEPRANESGSVFVFGAASLSGFNDQGYKELFRYVVSTGELTCVSCPGIGQKPAGNAETDGPNFERNGIDSYGLTGNAVSSQEQRILSGDGTRVFFESPDALVPQATEGVENVYEWENGTVYLISPPDSHQDSFILDSSASGGDVFFTTRTGLVPSDVDGAYDVYDARIPRPGDEPLPPAVPCEGSVCQGPPNTPQLLAPPSSETFSGHGNQSQVVEQPSEPNHSPPKHKAKRAKHHSNKKRRSKGHAKRGRKAGVSVKANGHAHGSGAGRNRRGK